MMKLSVYTFILIGVLALAGCSDTDEISEVDNDNGSDQISNDMSPEEARPEPPELRIQVGEETLSPVLGTYSWSVENEDRTFDGIEADSAAPPELVSTRDPIYVTADSTITFDFEEEPNRYTVRIWDEDNTIRSESDEVDLSGEGTVIYDVVAHWDQGTASYAFSLSIE